MIEPIFVLRITNLSFRTTEEKLRKEFEKFGDLSCCQLIINRDGLSKGIGIIKYSSNKDAQTALTEMVNSKIDDRKITIELQTEIKKKSATALADEKKSIHHSNEKSSTTKNNKYSHIKDNRFRH